MHIANDLDISKPGKPGQRRAVVGVGDRVVRPRAVAGVDDDEELDRGVPVQGGGEGREEGGPAYSRRGGVDVEGDEDGGHFAWGGVGEEKG